MGPKVRTAASIILRGPSDMYCDEMERSMHDALCVIKRVLESKSVVVGGGCVKLLSPFTLRISPPRSPAESSSPSQTSPSPSWLFPRHSQSTLPRTPQILWPS